MKNKSFKKITWLKLQLTTAVFTLIVVLISGFFVFSPMSWQKVALALSGNYNKQPGEQLTNDDWNLLDDDFGGGGNVSGNYVPLDGSQAMTGPLTLSGNTSANHAATRAYVDSSVAIQDASGNSLRMVCGETNNIWQQYNNPTAPETVYKVVDTSAFGFSTTPTYFTQLAGTDYLFRSIGGGAVYFPSNTGFTIYATTIDALTNPVIDINVANVQAWDWHIVWCAVGT